MNKMLKMAATTVLVAIATLTMAVPADAGVPIQSRVFDACC